MAKGISAKELLRRVETINPQAITREGVEETADIIVDTVITRLYDKGTKSDGSKISPYKIKEYAEKKYKMNSSPGYGTPDYHLTGETAREARIVTDETGFVFDSLSSGFKYLVKREGGKMEAFTMNNTERNSYVKNHLRPHVLRTGSSITGLSIVRK